MQAFKLMRQKGVGGVPVVQSGGLKAIGNISIRDVQFLLIAPEIYKNYRSAAYTAVFLFLSPASPPSVVNLFDRCY